jgi:predicted dehydrogenase
MIEAEHDQYFDYDRNHRLFAPELAGGALLDLGVYPVSFAQDLLGAPQEVVARGTLAPSGVDDNVSMILSYAGGQQALLHTASRGLGSCQASIVGTRGDILLPRQFYQVSSFTVTNKSGSWTYHSAPGEGRAYQAAAVAQALSGGETQSQRFGWADALEVMEVLDECRRQVGVVLPGE